MRMIIASDRPTRRARVALLGGSRSARIEMKMTLSMPSTISSVVNVSNATQISRLVIQSTNHPSPSMITGAEKRRCALARMRSCKKPPLVVHLRGLPESLSRATSRAPLLGRRIRIGAIENRRFRIAS